LADDYHDADGVAILSYATAHDRASDWFKKSIRQDAGSDDSGPYTVNHAMKDYLDWYRKRGRAIRSTEAAAKAHIEPVFGGVELGKLTTKVVRKWLDDLANAPARVRSRRSAAAPRFRAASADPEAKRRRRATANRVLHILKAAFNHAWREGKVATDEAWRRVSPFRDVDLPVVRYLTQAEQVRLANACPADFRPVVKGALLTGCRYGELTALRAADLNPETRTLVVRASKSGKSRHIVLTDEGARFFAQETTGKASDALIFTRPDGSVWGKSHQQRPLAQACKKAKIKPAVSFHVLRHTHGSTLAMKGAPLAVIAKQLGHADTRMTERHYAHLAPNYVADTIRAHFPELGIVPASNVTTLKPRKRAMT
jgi:integrase